MVNVFIWLKILTLLIVVNEGLLETTKNAFVASGGQLTGSGAKQVDLNGLSVSVPEQVEGTAVNLIEFATDLVECFNVDEDNHIESVTLPTEASGATHMLNSKILSVYITDDKREEMPINGLEEESKIKVFYYLQTLLSL